MEQVAGKYNPFTDGPVTKTEAPTGPFGKGKEPVQQMSLSILETPGVSVVKPAPPVKKMIGKSVSQIIIGIVPAKSNCYRIISFKSKPKAEDPEADVESQRSHYSLAKSGKLKKYEKDFALQAMNVRNLNIEEDFELVTDVYFKTRAADLDNSLKVILDCLQQVNAIKNDNQCMRIITNKHIDKANPRIDITINVL